MKSKRYQKLETAVTVAQQAIAEAQRAYQEARNNYNLHRLSLISEQPDVALPWSVLTDLDRSDQEQREAIHRSNSEHDQAARRKGVLV